VTVSPNLYFRELGERDVRDMWNAKFGREVYEVFSSFVKVDYEEFTEFVTSVLPGLADEFMVDYTRELSETVGFEAVIWDTAPMGQTLALLKTPALLNKHLKMGPRIYSRLRLGPRTKEPVLDAIGRWEQLSAADMDFLRTRVELTLVTIAEGMAVQQIGGIMEELKGSGVRPQRLIINNVVRDVSSDFMRQKAAGQKKYLEILRQEYGYLDVRELPLLADEVKGLDRLQIIARALYPG
jgi:anion-transporting  ArsA/GET3 family ATPase